VIAVMVAVAIAIVVVIIPVAVSMPTTIVFVPPLVVVSPAPLTRFAQFVARVFRLFAFPSMVFTSFMQLMVGFRQASLASAFIGPKSRCTHEKKRTRQRCGRKRCSSPKRFHRKILHLYSSLLTIGPGLKPR
jgi:hypothetical protein